MFQQKLQARRQWQDIFKELKGKILQPRLLSPSRISLKNDGEIKSFSDKQKLREFSIGVFDIVPEVSETILSSFHSFYFILLFRRYFHHCYWFLLEYFFISVIVLFVSVCLFFNSSMSLLIDTYIFFILLSRLFITFTIIILTSFSGSFPNSSLFIRTSVFLACSFICVVFLCLFIIIIFFF